jgi:arabinose-5-phosphate isomerase
MSESLKNIHCFQQVLLIESEAIREAAGRAGEEVHFAVEAILQCKGKVVVSGVGKSGIIARKIAATLSSTGTPAMFLHASEAFHGDLGVCRSGDVALLISHSGTTVELVRLIPILKAMQLKVIALVGNLHSPIARDADITLNAGVRCEADPLNMVPTSSSSVALAMGDALAVCLMEARKFSRDDFARFHPGGQLGKNLLWKVHQVMHPIEKVARVAPDTSIKDVIIAMTHFPLGAACVVNEQNQLLGIITDGDIRRKLGEWNEISGKTAADAMTPNPSTISKDETLIQAIEMMEKRHSAISVLPVVQNGILKGLIRIHDVY